jgi:ribosomal-protein-serine acetyltransferase
MALGNLTIDLDDDIQLRLPREEDAQEVFDLIQRDRDRFEPYMEWIFHVTEVEHELEFIRTRLAQFAVGSAIQLFIWKGGRIAGSIGTVVIDRENDAAEVGYMVFREHEGTGLAFRSVQALIGHLFEAEGMHRIVVKVMPSNARSNALARRMGFAFEGVQREAYKRRGRFEDLNVYSLLSTERHR